MEGNNEIGNNEVLVVFVDEESAKLNGYVNSKVYMNIIKAIKLKGFCDVYIHSIAIQDGKIIPNH